MGQLWVGMEVGGASVTCVCEGRVCSLRSCVRRCVLHLVPAQVLLWVEGAWPTRVQAACRASAVLAVWGTPCPSGTASSPRLSSPPGPRLLCPGEPSPDIPSGSEGKRA